MAVKVTRAFSQSFASASDEAIFIDAFTRWKANWAQFEYESQLFGKDGSYVHPKVAGEKYKLRHVHLIPITDATQLSLWKKWLSRKTRKTSDRALVYAHNGAGDYLLIYILPEPDAHNIAEMKTSENAALMIGFAATAAAFLHNGSVIA